MRQLHNLGSKMQDRCATVSTYEAAGKAEALEEVKGKLVKTEGQLKEQRRRNKVGGVQRSLRSWLSHEVEL